MLQNYEQFQTDENCPCLLKYTLNALNTSKNYKIEESRNLFQKIEKNQLHMIDL
jgi:hypothetical protein